MTATSLFLKTTAIFVVLSASLSKHIRKTAVLFKGKNSSAIFAVYIGPRENDDKEYLFF